ncbi:MAG: cyclodeaminase/cyclohydrolase family protein [Melioribacteraceae bacterium]|jgi:formiminotetrahydrofolate cyclodeaminase|nr:cyclodeaminase/cyclohydrolase family protein [Melioribacteraceae bacterium]
MNLTKSLQEYFNELSSSSPTPGGGNVAAFCGALSSSLGTMVCNLTIGKKKYADVEQEMISMKESLVRYQNEFLNLAQKDNESFDRVMEAFKLPKETDAEKEERINKIEQATIGAAEVPSEVMKKCYDLIPILKTISDKGNKNSLSDAGVAIALVRTSTLGAYLNVLINCGSLNNQTIAEEMRKRANIIFEEVERSTTQILGSITKSFLPL